MMPDILGMVEDLREAVKQRYGVTVDVELSAFTVPTEDELLATFSVIECSMAPECNEFDRRIVEDAKTKWVTIHMPDKHLRIALYHDKRR